jgi:hypothetical protein
MSTEEWLDGFRRDANPESEVRWWERLTRCYRGYSDTRELSSEQKKALFSVVFRLGMGSDEQALVTDLAKRAVILPGALSVVKPGASAVVLDRRELSDMALQDAVAIIHATLPETRSRYAKEISWLRRAHGTDRGAG